MNALDRELSELLAVQPSPEFAAKVRVRIEQQPTPSFAWRWWAAGAIVTAAVLVIAVGADLRRTPPVTPAVQARPDVALPSPNPDWPKAIETAPHAPPRVVVHVPNRTEPETLVDPSLAAAVRRLASDQRVLPEMPAEASLDAVVVEPLKVPEIADSGAKQGDRQ
jgi:hypothetical protein